MSAKHAAIFGAAFGGACGDQLKLALNTRLGIDDVLPRLQ